VGGNDGMAGYVVVLAAAWIGVGVLLAACTGDDGDFSHLGKVAVFILVVLVWPMIFLPLSVLRGED
jgi:hypothetical protein